jgi:squalene synthase HpnC
MRRDLTALYGFARLADQIGDEHPGDRGAALDELEADLLRAFDGEPHHPLLRGLVPTLREAGMHREPFQRLIEANRRDQQVSRYATWGELLEYCALSANPVGEWVLELAGAATPERLAASDAVCSALQVIEHCQDVVEDFAAGRIYLPQEDLVRVGCREKDFESVPAAPALRRAVALASARARVLLNEGRPLVASLHGPYRLAVAGFVAGGFSALDALESAGFDPVAGPATVSPGRLARRALGLWLRAGRTPA